MTNNFYSRRVKERNSEAKSVISKFSMVFLPFFIFVLIFNVISIGFSPVLAQEGTNCDNAKVVTLGATKGNGERVQYFSFTPTEDGYVKIIATQDTMSILVQSGNCGALTEVVTLSHSKPGWDILDDLFYAKANQKYTLLVENLYGKDLILESFKSKSMLASMYIHDNKGYYSIAVIDTVNKVVDFGIRSDIDITNVSYYLHTRGHNYSIVSVHDTVLSNWGNINLEKLLSIDVKDKNDLTSVTYSVTITKEYGQYCESAKEASIGATVGNGSMNQYFSYKPSQSSYIKLYSTGGNFRGTIYKGECGNLTSVGSLADHIMYAEASTNYVFDLYDLNSDSLVIEQIPPQPHKLTFLGINSGTSTYYAIVDTIKNTIKISLPSNVDLTNVQFLYSVQNPLFSIVSVNNTLLEYSGVVDLTKVSSLEVKDSNDPNSSITYSIVVIKKYGEDCESAKEASIGSTVGNGNTNQYFKYKPSQSGYIKLRSTGGNFGGNIYKGECGNLTSLKSVGSVANHIMYAEAPTNYVFELNSINSDSLVIEKTPPLSKGITSFNITDGYRYYVSTIDTVQNIIEFTVPSDYDLTNTNFTLGCVNSEYSTVIAHDSVLTSSGLINLEKASTILVKDKYEASSFLSYIIKITKEYGKTCESAIVASVGANHGIGDYQQYFTYTQGNKDEYLKITSLKENFYAELTTGKCNNLQDTFVMYNSNNEWDNKYNLFYARANQKYNILVDGLWDSDFRIEPIESKPKPKLKSLSFTDGLSYYDAVIDTVKNEVEISVLSNSDLSNVSFSLNTEYDVISTVSVHDSVLSNKGRLNLENVSSFVVTDKNELSSFTTYSVKIIRLYGNSCENAKEASIGSTVGNGNTNQYFSYNPSQSGYIKLRSTGGNFGGTFYSGECDNLTRFIGLSNIASHIMYTEVSKKYVFELEGINSDSLVIEQIPPQPHKLISLEINSGTSTYYAIVDTIKNTIEITVPSNVDLTNVKFLYSVQNPWFSTVSVNNTLLEYSGVVDLTKTTSLEVKDSNDPNSSITYSIVVIKKYGENCENAKEASIGSTVGNGQYNQYFSYKPSQSGYIKLRSTGGNFGGNIYKGECGNLTSLESVGSVADHLMFAEAPTNYVFELNSINSDSLKIEEVSFPQKLSTFSISDGYSTYFASIDSINNSISFTVPLSFNRTNVSYSLLTVSDGYSIVSVNDSILNNSGIVNLDKLTTLIVRYIHDDKLLTTYTVNVIVNNGESCERSVEASLGSNVGNGKSYEYFTYTPQQSGYVKIYSKNSFWGYLYTGDCENLNKDQISSSSSELGIDSYVAYMKANEKYTIMVYNLESDSLIIEPVSPSLDITYMMIRDNYYNYIAEIDTVNNTLYFNVPEKSLNLSKLSFSMDYTWNSKVSINDSLLSNYGSFDLSNVSSFVVHDINDANLSSVYTLSFLKKIGDSCKNPTEATLGVNAGNGDDNQYFTYTPQQSGYVQIYPSNNNITGDIYTGSCDNLIRKFDISASSDNLQNLWNKAYLKANEKYTIRINNLYSENLIIKQIAPPSLDVSYFVIKDSNGNSYVADIDTVDNTINFEVPAANINLANLDFTLYYTEFFKGSINDSLLSNSGKIDLSKVSSLKVHDFYDENRYVTYTITFNAKKGESCKNAQNIFLGMNPGNGDYIQYFTYTPYQSGYVQIYPSNNNITGVINTGSCANLVKKFDISASSDNIQSHSNTAYLKANEEYIIQINGLYSDKIVIEQVDAPSLDITYFAINDSKNNVYVADIDANNNTVNFNVPAANLNLANLDFTLYYTWNSKVSINDSLLSNSGKIDLSKVSSLKVRDIYDNTRYVTYTITFIKKEGESCNSAKEATFGLNAGNGKEQQYFAFNPQTTGYVRITSPQKNIQGSIYNGTCDNLRRILDYHSYYDNTDNADIIYVNAGEKYVFEIDYLYSGNLKIESIPSIPLDISYLSINHGLYVAQVDTVKNTIDLTVPANEDLSNVSFTLYTINDDHLRVSAYDSILSHSGYVDLRKITTFVVTDKNNPSLSSVYKLNIIKQYGLSCDLATVITSTATVGNGASSRQYFSYTQPQNGYIKIYPSLSDGSVSVYLTGDIYSGSCDDLIDESFFTASISSTSLYSALFYAKANTKYTLSISSLKNDSLIVEKLASLPLEIELFVVNDGANSYLAEIDNVKKTMNFIIPSSVNLTNLSYDLFTDLSYKKVSVNDSVITRSGKLNLSKVKLMVVRDVNNAASSLTYTITVNKNDVGFNTEYNKLISIYPNPTIDELYISNLTGKATVLIYNVGGKKVFEGIVTDGKINVSQLASGVYTVRITENNKVSTIKMVKR